MERTIDYEPKEWDNVTTWRRWQGHKVAKCTEYYGTDRGEVLYKYRNKPYKVPKPHGSGFSSRMSDKLKYRNPHGFYKMFQLGRPDKVNGKFKAPLLVFYHRFIATLFCQKPELFATQVDHIDGNNLNNAAYNLQWVTQSENIDRAIKMKRGEIVISNLIKSKYYAH